VNARTAKGNKCFPTSNKAVCWCLIGATLAVDSSGLGLDIENAMVDFLGIDGLITWNDTAGRTQREVLAAIDGTIEGLTTDD